MMSLTDRKHWRQKQEVSTAPCWRTLITTARCGSRTGPGPPEHSVDGKDLMVSVWVYLLRFESSSQLVLLVLQPDLDVVDLVLVEDHQSEGLVGLLPGAVPHQVGPILNTNTRLSVVKQTGWTWIGYL